MCDPCTRAALRAAKALAKSSAARCIQPDGLMPWMPMIADTQAFRTKDGEVPLHEIERRELEAFTRRMNNIFGPWLRGVFEEAASRRLQGREAITFIAQRAATLAPQLAELISDAAGPYGQFMARAGVQAGLSQVEQAGRIRIDDEVVFDEASEYAARAAREASQRMGQSAANTHINRIEEIIARGIEDQKTTEEVMADLKELGFDEVSANRIARTESVRAYTEGQVDAWRESGVVTRKQWLLSPTSCEFCEIAAREYGEQGVELDQPFFRNGDVIVNSAGQELNLKYGDVNGPPLHPFCRCTLVPVMDI